MDKKDSDIKLISNAFDWLFKTDKNQIVIAQPPNVSISLVVVFWVASTLIDAQPYNNLFVMLYRILLLYWASLEIKSGVNHFRNLLGTLVFAVVLAGFLNQLL